MHKVRFSTEWVIAPMIVKIKLLIQALWGRGLDWDTKVPNESLRQ